MTKEIKSDDEQATPVIDIDSVEREGNDVSSLVGSGAPMVKVRANAGILGLTAGEVGNFIQTEEIRLNVANGNLSVITD